MPEYAIYDDGTEVLVVASGGPRGQKGDQYTFLLEAGQTVADYETLHGVTIPVGAIIYQKV